MGGQDVMKYVNADSTSKDSFAGNTAEDSGSVARSTKGSRRILDAAIAASNPREIKIDVDADVAMKEMVGVGSQRKLLLMFVNIARGEATNPHLAVDFRLVSRELRCVPTYQTQILFSEG